MNKLTRRTMTGWVLATTVLAFLPGATGADRSKDQGQATILAVSENGTTWFAGKAKFRLVGTTLEVNIDLASGVPNARFWLYVSTDPSVITVLPPIQGVRTDAHGNVKYTEWYGISATAPPFAVWMVIVVEGATETFTSKLDPVTLSP